LDDLVFRNLDAKLFRELLGAVNFERPTYGDKMRQW
jgi:hypothetical protein